MPKLKALIAGATGVVGRNLLRHLLATGDWEVVTLSRRKPDVEGAYEHIAIDLLDAAQCQAKLAHTKSPLFTRSKKVAPSSARSVTWTPSFARSC